MPDVYEKNIGWSWDMPLYIGGLWPVYWAEDSVEVKRRFFLGKRKLVAYLTKRKLMSTNFKIIDRQGILK
tara:strand:+ start:608 stop:817 length:210 start_codon:yes stop_codon:yes gene_type:complete